jgi:hypothetical protein
LEELKYEQISVIEKVIEMKGGEGWGQSVMNVANKDNSLIRNKVDKLEKKHPPTHSLMMRV